MRSTESNSGPAEYGLLGISLPENDHLSLSGRIYAEIREAIIAGRIASGQRLPSSRALADELGVARGTVVEAYEQLGLEGYVRTERGSGTFVDDIPEHFLQVPTTRATDKDLGKAAQSAAPSGERHGPIIDYAQARVPRPFQPGLPPLDRFPRHSFARLSSEALRTLTFEELAYGDPRGYLPLREAVAAYLRTARAVDCDPDQVFITNGAQHALSLSAHILVDRGESVWIENPGYRGAYAAFVKAGLKVVPVAVEEDGLSVEVGRDMDPDARLIYVTPSHQYPMGVTMSARRRLELVEWARRRDAWIIEDDYDSEYRYDGAPLPALHHFDGGRRVVYIGSMSKILAPALRIGYVVVPQSLVNVFTTTRAADDHHSPITTQTVLARFISRGHYGRHLRRMRKLGEMRRDALTDAFTRRLPQFPLTGTGGGLHALLRLDPNFDDAAFASSAAPHGVSLSPLSAYDLRKESERGLVLGYAAYTMDQIESAVATLARLFEEVC